MYNIAIVSSGDQTFDEYGLALTNENCNVTSLNSDQITEENIQEMDAVIIEEINSDNIGKTCELIIQVKNISNGLIWIVSKESRKNNRIIYLQLGVKGTIETKIEADELALLVRMELDRLQDQSNDGWTRKIAINNSSEADAEKRSIKLLPDIMGVKIAGKADILLTRLEYRALSLLIKFPNQVVTYEELFQQVWEKEAEYSTFRLANLVSHLRKKVEIDPDKPIYIKTIRLKGYMLSV